MSGIRAGIKNVHIDSDTEDHKSIYKYTSWQGGELTARISYNNDGSINADNTYNEWYNKKHKLGSFAKSDDDDAKKERSKAKSKSGGGSCLRTILCLPLKGLWCSTKSFLTLLGLAFIFKLFGDDE